jgi:hypothetical protein
MLPPGTLICVMRHNVTLYSEEGGSRFLRNVSSFRSDYVASQPIRQHSSSLRKLVRNLNFVEFASQRAYSLWGPPSLFSNGYGGRFALG